MVMKIMMVVVIVMKARQSSPPRRPHIMPALHQAYFLICDISRGTWRVEDYCSFMAIRATNGETDSDSDLRLIPTRTGPDHPGVEFSLTMFEDPGCQLPESITRFLAFNPKFIRFSWEAIRALSNFIFVFVVLIRLFAAGWQCELCRTSSQTCGWPVSSLGQLEKRYI